LNHHTVLIFSEIFLKMYSRQPSEARGRQDHISFSQVAQQTNSAALAAKSTGKLFSSSDEEENVGGFSQLIRDMEKTRQNLLNGHYTKKPTNINYAFCDTEDKENASVNLDPLGTRNIERTKQNLLNGSRNSLCKQTPLRPVNGTERIGTQSNQTAKTNILAPNKLFLPSTLPNSKPASTTSRPKKNGAFKPVFKNNLSTAFKPPTVMMSQSSQASQILKSSYKPNHGKSFLSNTSLLKTKPLHPQLGKSKLKKVATLKKKNFVAKIEPEDNSVDCSQVSQISGDEHMEREEKLTVNEDNIESQTTSFSQTTAVVPEVPECVDTIPEPIASVVNDSIPSGNLLINLEETLREVQKEKLSSESNNQKSNLDSKKASSSPKIMKRSKKISLIASNRMSRSRTSLKLLAFRRKFSYLYKKDNVAKQTESTVPCSNEITKQTVIVEAKLSEKLQTKPTKLSQTAESSAALSKVDKCNIPHGPLSSSAENSDSNVRRYFSSSSQFIVV